MNNGSVQCWGSNSLGQLGNGSIDVDGDANDGNPYPPGYVSGLSPTDDAKAIAITAGALHTCALLSTGAVECWGYDNVSQTGFLGSTLPIPEFQPTPISIENFA